MMARDSILTGLYVALAVIAIVILAVICRDVTGRWPWQDKDGGET